MNYPSFCCLWKDIALLWEEKEKVLNLNMTVPRLTTLLLLYFVRTQNCLHTQSLEKGKQFLALIVEFTRWEFFCDLREISPNFFFGTFRETKSELNKPSSELDKQRREESRGDDHIGCRDTCPGAILSTPLISLIDFYPNLGQVYTMNGVSESPLSLESPWPAAWVNLFLANISDPPSLTFSSLTSYYFPPPLQQWH